MKYLDKIIKYIENNLILCLSLFCFFVYSCQFIQRIFTSNSGLIVKLNFVLIGFSIVYLLNLIVLNKYSSKFFIILFILINSVILYFMNNFNVAINYDVISNVFGTNFSEAVEFINLKLIIYVICFGFIPLLFLLKVKLDNFNLKKRLIMIIVIIIYYSINLTISLFNNNYLLSLKQNKRNIEYLIPVNYIKATADFIRKSSFFSIKNKKPIINIEEQNNLLKHNKKNLIVFVLGESARANNFSLNGYKRNTNEPLLLHKNLINFSNFYSCGTSTFISVPCIFSHLGKNDFSTKEFEKYENLVDIFNKINYKVKWYSNNGSCKKVCDRIHSKIVNVNYDIELLEYLKKTVIDNSTDDLFIVLHQRGSHGPRYNERYPKEFKKFEPVCIGELQQCGINERINAYDNSIYYTSYILSETLNFLKQNTDNYNIMFIYVSDHGDSLGENGQLMHGYPYIIANKFQKHVPFILWFSDDFVKDYKIDLKKLKNITKNKFSQDNIFHSMIGLFGINSDYYKKELDLFK